MGDGSSFDIFKLGLDVFLEIGLVTGLRREVTP